jgi:hypothetical protein
VLVLVLMGKGLHLVVRLVLLLLKVELLLLDGTRLILLSLMMMGFKPLLLVML